jgi:glucose/mannose-6-phosphate isomerase
MKDLIAAFPDNIIEALKIAENASIQPLAGNVTNVVICGMGGSGIGGKIVSQWISKYAQLPVLFAQDYSLPAFVGPNTLVIGSSYSGNTEETLIALLEAKERGSRVIGICSGGDLKSFCERNQYDCVVVPGGNPPRTALAFSMVQLTSIFVKLGMAPKELLEEIKLGHQLIVNSLADIQAEAKQIAGKLFGKIVGVYAGADYEGVAIRAKQQFNENSKELCWQHVIPEMNHNELVGWGDGNERFAALFIHTDDLNKRNERRFNISVDIVRTKTPHVVLIEAKGKTQIQKSIYLIHLIDWTSLYWSDLKDGDPIEIRVIDYLKDELSKL